MNSRRTIFITGGTGFIGSRLIALLLDRGLEVHALVRPGSEQKLPAGCTPIQGDALDGSTYVDSIRTADTFVHLVIAQMVSTLTWVTENPAEGTRVLGVQEIKQKRP